MVARALQILVVGGLFSLGSSCARLPIVGAERTGEPLAVRTEQRLHTYTERVKVGDVQHRDQQGRDIGRSEVYEDRQGISTSIAWFTTQGDSRIDEYDFYRIAGDDQTAEHVLKYRTTGLVFNRVGWGLMGGGLAGILLGAFVATNQNTQIAGGVTSLVGLAMGLAGYFLMNSGQHRLDSDAHATDPGKAYVTASRYNAALQATPAAPPPSALLPRLPAR